jgi:hypothetical protein
MEKLSFTKRILLTFLSLFFFISVSINYALGAAPHTIGQVVWVKNILKAQQPNAEIRQLTRRSAIYEHDTLMTDSTSSGEVVFTDDSALALREDSTVKIDRYSHKNNAPSTDAFVVNIVKGGFRTITGAISKNNPGGYKATTPVATIGVMGTAYSLYFDPFKSSMDIKLDKGSIVVANQQGSVTLTQCTGAGAGSTGCISNLYARVEAHVAPQTVTQQPAVFNAEPPLTTTVTSPSPSSPAASESPSPAAATTESAPQSNDSGTTGSFCIN